MATNKNESKKIKVLIVDDHPIVRDGLAYIFGKESDMEICGYVEDADAAVAAIEKLSPDIAIVDISLKGNKSGLELTRLLHTSHPKLYVLILSMHDEALYAQRVIRSGARGYVTKHEMSSTIVAAVRKVLSGKIYLSDTQTSRFIDDLVVNQNKIVTTTVEKLTNKELDVFRLIGQGKKNSEIADALNVSIKTIDTHRLRIKNKLGMKSGAELIKYAVEWFMHQSE